MGNCMSAEAAAEAGAPPPRPAGGNGATGAGAGAGNHGSKQQAPSSARAKQYYEDDQSKAIIEGLAGAYKVLRLLGSGEPVASTSMFACGACAWNAVEPCAHSGQAM